MDHESALVLQLGLSSLAKNRQLVVVTCRGACTRRLCACLFQFLTGAQRLDILGSLIVKQLKQIHAHELVQRVEFASPLHSLHHFLSIRPRAVVYLLRDNATKEGSEGLKLCGGTPHKLLDHFFVNLLNADSVANTVSKDSSLHTSSRHAHVEIMTPQAQQKCLLNLKLVVAALNATFCGMRFVAMSA